LAGADQIIHCGDSFTRIFSVWWLRQKTAVAAFTMNCPDEEREVVPKWIESGKILSPGKLEDASQSISHALA